jgi:hypothetical protein
MATVGAYSCADEDGNSANDPATLPNGTFITAENAVIQTVDGIEFKFCLLNKDSVPATTFNEGEIFNYYVAVKNTTSANKKILDLLPAGGSVYDEGKHFLQRIGIPSAYLYRASLELEFLAGETIAYCGPGDLIPSEGEQVPIIPAGSYTFEFQIQLELILKDGILSFNLPISVQ